MVSWDTLWSKKYFVAMISSIQAPVFINEVQWQIPVETSDRWCDRLTAWIKMVDYLYTFLFKIPCSIGPMCAINFAKQLAVVKITVKASSFLDRGVVRFRCVVTLSLNLCLISTLSLNTWLVQFLRYYRACWMRVVRCLVYLALNTTVLVLHYLLKLNRSCTVIFKEK